MRFNPIQILAFLESGAFIKWDEEHWLLSWNLCEEELKAAPSWVLGQFYKDPKPTYFYSHTLVKTSDFLQDLQDSGLNLDFRSTRLWQEPTRNSFNQQMELIFNEMSLGSLKKAVPVIYEHSEGEFSNPEKLKVLIHLLKNPSLQNAYGHWHKDKGVIGLTPEILFEIKEDVLSTVALAGTKSENSKLSLLDDPKEMNEHQLVIDRIKKQLGPLGQLDLSQTYEASFKNIIHLKTDIKLQLSESLDPVKLVNLLHPTPALGVHSDQLDHYWLKNLDQCSEAKMFFGAPMGASFMGHTRILVGIRNIQWFDDKTYLGSGCGIVKQSQPDKEWAELKLKRNVVKQNLGL